MKRRLRWLVPLLAIVGACLAAVLIWRYQSPPSSPNAYTPRTAGTLTFEHIAPIVFESCGPCHRPGGSAPFDLLTYEDVKKRTRQILIVTETRFMPPWLPDPGLVAFADDRSLTDDEIGMIHQWVEEGAAGCDPADLPAPPEWHGGWQLGEPDLVVSIPEDYLLRATGRDAFRNLVIPLPVPGRRYVRAVELLPGNPKVIHHAIIQIDPTRASQRLDDREADPGFGGMEMGASAPPDGHFLGWTPGRMPYTLPERMAWTLEPGTDLVLQLHMVPSGKPEPIRPRVGLFFADAPPTEHPYVILLRNDNIDIPPNTDDVFVEDAFTLPVDVEAVGIYPHAHYLGKDIQAYATLPDGTRRWLIRISDWDFNWQDEYRFARPVALPKGSVLSMRISFDNRADNVLNPNHPPRRVRYGLESDDEMATLSIQVLPRSAGDRAILDEAFTRHTVGRSPRSWKALNNLGIAQKTRGRLAEAVETFQRALVIDPNSDVTHSNLAGALQLMGRIDEAVTHYRRVIEMSPDFSEAHFNIALALASRGRIDEAITHLETVVRLNPEDAESLGVLANMLLRRGRAAEAIAHLRRAVSLDPEAGEAHASLGGALMHMKQAAEAVRHLREAVRLLPRAPGPPTQLAWILGTHPDPQMRDSAEAVALAERAADLTQRRNATVLDVLAAAYAADGRFDQAVIAARAAVELATRSGATDRVDPFRQRLELYQNEQPYILPATDPTGPGPEQP